MEHDAGPFPQRWALLVEAIATMGLKEAIDHNTNTQQEMVDGLDRIADAITRLTETLENK